MVLYNSEKFRAFLSQFIASSSKNCLLLTVGVGNGLPTVIIPYLTNDRDQIKFSYDQASWFASFKPIAMIFGTILSGYFCASLGRKRAMLISILPSILGMGFLHFANSAPMIFIGIASLGVGSGLGLTASLTYIAEVCQPSFRGMLLTLSQSMYQLGTLLAFLLGSLLPWRTVVALAIILPIIDFIFIVLSPEVPSWLLLKDRQQDAQASLQWLRGWVSFEKVKTEFEEIEMSVAATKEQCESCTQAQKPCDHLRRSFIDRVQQIFERKNLSVLFIVIVLFVIIDFKGRYAMQPFIIPILTAFGAPIDAKWGTVIIGASALLGRILSIPEVKYLGKRKSCLLSIGVIAISFLVLGTYATVKLPYRWTSFQQEANIHVETSSIPLIFFVLTHFCTGLVIEGIPWISAAEMFPLRNRSSCISLVLIVKQLSQFTAVKCYIYLETGWGLSGAMWFFGSVGIAGFAFIYFCLPETEGISINDIENFFSDEKRKITDVDIKKYLRKKEKCLEDSS